MHTPRLAAAFLLAIAATSHAAEPADKALRDELLAMREHDQQARKATTQEEFRKWVETDAANQKRLKEIVARHGWPTYSMVGQDAADAAWLIVQHSDSDKDFQLKVLDMMGRLVKQGEASAKLYAYLYDRTHAPQRYGTQGSCVSRQEWQPYEIEDIAGVDGRRRELGMPPLAEYAKLFDCSPPYVALHDPVRDPRRTVPVPKP